MADSRTIPVVSFEKFLTGDRTAQQEVAKQVYDAFSSVGFIYLKDHGIPQTRVEEIFKLVSTILSWNVSSIEYGLGGVSSKRVPLFVDSLALFLTIPFPDHSQCSIEGCNGSKTRQADLVLGRQILLPATRR